MKRWIALLCFLAILFGSAFSDEVAPAPDEIIVEVQEEPSEEILVEEPSEEPEIEQEVAQEPDPDPPQEVIEEATETEVKVDEPEKQVELEVPQVEVEEPDPEPEQKDEPADSVPVNEEPQEETTVVETEPAVETPTEPIVETKLKEEVPIAADPEPEVEEITEPQVIATSSTMIPEEEVEIADDDWGHVDDAILPREVHISFLKEPQFFSDEVILVATLINFRFEDSYTIYWQYCEDPTAEEIEWKDIEGEHSQVYNFILDKTNYVYGYRVIVVVED